MADWSSIVGVLMTQGQFDQAAVIGVDGKLFEKTPDFNLQSEETAQLAKIFSEPKKDLQLDGKGWSVVIQQEPLLECGPLSDHNEKAHLMVFKTNTCMLIGKVAAESPNVSKARKILLETALDLTGRGL